MSGPHRSLHNRTLPPLATTSNGPTVNSKAQKTSGLYPNKATVYSMPSSKPMMSTTNHSPKKSVASKSMQLTADMVSIYLRENPQFLEKFVLENISREEVKKWNSTKSSLSRDMKLLESSSGSNAIKTMETKSSKDGNRPSTSTRKALIERSSLLRDLTRDIHHKPNKARILSELKDCIATAVGADGANLYLVDETEEYVYYYNPEEDNTQETSPCVRKIGYGSILAAFVADTKDSERIADICTPNDLYPEALPISNSMVQSVLVQPILQEDGRVAGVVELYRTVGKRPFLVEDEEIMTSYLVWGGVAVVCSEIVINYCGWGCAALYYAEMYHKNIRQQRLNQFILEVTQSIFGNFKSMEYVIKDIMKYAKDLVKADRASLFMVDKDTAEIYSSVFDTGSFDKSEFVTKETVIRFPIDRGISGHVAITGETLNIVNAYADSRFNREIDQQTGYLTKTILCMPVKLQEEVIGVVQMLNKIGGNFSRDDESHFKTFASYCGLALHIAKMYEKIRRSEQKHKVALEVLSYHSQYSQDEFNRLRAAEMPVNIPGITDFYFSPWGIDEFNKPLTVIYMFCDLFGMQIFDRETLTKFTLTVRKNYRKVPYHNWAHAFSVAHAMYTILKTTAHNFTVEESVSLYVASLCHDLDHRGKTNQFMVKSAAPLAAIYSTSTMEHHHFKMTVTILQQIALFVGCICHDIDHRGKTNSFIHKSDSPLACLYSTSVMEHHHFNITVMVLQRSGHNIFKHLSSDRYKQVLGNIKHCILATDLAKFFDYKAKLEGSLKQTPFNWDAEDMRLTLMAVSMTTCDLCSMYKPWKIQLGLVLVIMEEFWLQGDEEKLQGQSPIRMMDRAFTHELPESQVGFIKGICLPCYSLLVRVLPEGEPMVSGASSNLGQWETLAAMDKAKKEVKLNEMVESIQNGSTVLNMT